MFSLLVTKITRWYRFASAACGGETRRRRGGDTPDYLSPGQGSRGRQSPGPLLNNLHLKGAGRPPAPPAPILADERFSSDLCYCTRRGNVCTYVLQQQAIFVDAANHIFDLRLLESDVAQCIAASQPGYQFMGGDSIALESEPDAWDFGKLAYLIIQAYNRDWHRTPPWFQASFFFLIPHGVLSCYLLFKSANIEIGYSEGERRYDTPK